jgi:hypothetical protein
MMLSDRIREFLQRLTPLTRSNLLTELERLEVSGDELPGASAILENLRAEFRANGKNADRAGNPARYFFAPCEPLLVDGAPEHANSGRIQRGSLVPIWEWVCRDMLPTMARDYIARMDELVASDSQREARKVAATFQSKVLKSIESTLGSTDGAGQIRAKLAIYTASHAAYDDVTKMLCVFRARDGLAAFNEALPAKIEKFDDARIAKVTQLLDAFGKSHAEALPFALALVAGRLRTSWHLIWLAIKAAPSKNAADVAATRFAIVVSMVLDRLDDKRSALRVVLRNNRVMVAKELLNDIYDTDYALRFRIDQFDQSDWGQRLDNLMEAIAALVQTEVRRFPANVGHVLGSHRRRSHQSLGRRLTQLAGKARNTISEGAAYCRRLVSQPEKSRA